MVPKKVLAFPQHFPTSYHPWQGGRYREVDGMRSYYIRRRLGDGIRKEFALGTISESDAKAELALFNRDPAAYQTPKERAASKVQRSGQGAVKLDAATLKDFLKHCNGLVKKGELSEGYVGYTLVPYLQAWSHALRDRDLHKVSLDDLQACLKSERWSTATHKRVVALKAFTAWARTEKDAPKLRRPEDPTIDLLTPKIVAEKSKRRKDYTIAFVEEFYRNVPDQGTRDRIRLRACAHGLHDTEIDRLAAGDGELEVVDDKSGIYGVLTFWHDKKGDDHSIPVDRATFEAAKRLHKAHTTTWAARRVLERVSIEMHGCGGVTKVYGQRTKGTEKETGYTRIGETVTKLVPCAKCPRLQPNQLRHSFATWARQFGEKVVMVGQQGVPLEEIADAMGHTRKKTTKGFYMGKHIPPMIRIPIKLAHPDDP